MAGAAACTKQPKEPILPYVRQPENVVPGLPLFYATAMTTGGYARGILVESHLNRPTKVKVTPIIRPASVQPSFSSKPRSSISTILTAPKPSSRSARSLPGASSLAISAAKRSPLEHVMARVWPS